MDWVKLTTNYYLDAAVMRAGEAAEVLFTRGLAYVGDQESDGVVPREALARLTPTRGPARAAALVREGLWEVVPGGWRFTTWERHQETRDQLEARREAGRARQARHRRARSGVSNAVTTTVRDASVTGTEVEEEVEAAAAAAALDGPLDVLRAKLQAHTPLRALRFDSLTAEQRERIEALLEVHGDDPLVRVAVETCRNPAPVHVGAFLGSWEAMPAPGARRLGVVRPRLCEIHQTTLTPSGACTSCASDQIASDR